MIKKTTTKKEKRAVRQRRVRAKISGTSERPRLSVFKSNKFIYGQLIDDITGKTIVSVSSRDKKEKSLVERAKSAGGELSKLAKEKKIEKIIFDRGGYVYTGVVKSFAEGVREGGLIF